MFPLEIIHEKIAEAKLRHLLIGGQAINTYGVPRDTIDVDFLIPSTEGDAWRSILEGEGFKEKHDGGTFIQFSPPYGVDWPLDLMLVNETTFEKLAGQSREVECLGIVTRVPSVEHLMALKLHAAVNGPKARMEKDFPDVIRLAKMTDSDPRSVSIKEVFERYGTPDLYERFLRTFE